MEDLTTKALEWLDLLDCDLQATNDLLTRTINGKTYFEILDTIKQALTTKSKKEQAWDIVKEMQLSTLNIIGKCNLYEDYLTFYDFKKSMGNPLNKQLTKEEFNLLKEVVGE